MAVSTDTLPPPDARAGADFPDWLSPMLVKELRQGVRTRVFVSMFILLQVAMLLTVSLTLLVAANGGGTTEGSAVFWLIVAVPALMVLPLNGLGAVNGEIRANTLELIFLSRLTAFRIVAGKWLAIFAQCLLFIVAVLPYLVLRYFIGGINVADELQRLGWMLVGAAVLSAVATGLSAYPPRIVRVAVALLGFFGIFILGGAFSLFVRGPAVTGGGPGTVEVVALLLCAGIVVVLALEIGVLHIAPLAENHSVVLRLLAVGACLVALAASLLASSTEEITFLACLITGFVALIAVNEQPRWLPRLFAPFAARGILGRLTAGLLYPGWHTGVVFAVVMTGAVAALLARQHMLIVPSSPSWYGLWIVVLLGALLLPVALARTAAPRLKWPAVPFVIVQMVSALVAIVALICDNALGTKLANLVSVLPLTALIVSVNNHPSHTFTVMIVPCVTTLVSLCLLVFAIAREWSRGGRALAENRRLGEAAAAPSTLPPPAPDESMV